jgi:hypothetical protein
MLKAAGYSDPVHLMQLAYDVEYRIASFDNSEEISTCAAASSFPAIEAAQFRCLSPWVLLCPTPLPAADARAIQVHGLRWQRGP